MRFGTSFRTPAPGYPGGLPRLDPNSHRYPYSHSDSGSYRNPHGNTGSYSNPYSYANANPYPHADSRSYCNRYRYSHANTRSHRNGDSNSATHPPRKD